jgi:gamma-glutamylcyclotransferase (GGCT)/AIG2-like uncharacterized protein YtfP
LSQQWYFAYGSNLKHERLSRRIGESSQILRATLQNYRLTFAKGWSGHDSGKANILQQQGSEVKGAVYSVTQDQLLSLDGPEGVNSGVYKRIPVIVLIDGQPTPAQTYVMVRQICPARPADWYLDLILKGLEQNGYSQAIIDEVRNIANSLG